eukprot:CAMPEP_0179902832 /NCGR_PEP_ID=MMETSP0982-20121206/40838_1 /TAXON_ID=483367 /ORGANISM="non described non described, Strain CCMP 2436" /LENGTH=451 /DNA_ID=CAMNT_0021802133 /DNA_START=297 /DNA_END=1648 /DNA_ORIENTATION=-
MAEAAGGPSTPHTHGGPNIVDGRLDVTPLHYRTAASVLRERDRIVLDNLKLEATRRDAQARLNTEERVRRAEGAARLEKLLALTALRVRLGGVYHASAAYWQDESDAARDAAAAAADAIAGSQETLVHFLRLRDLDASERERHLASQIDEACEEATTARGDAARAMGTERLVWRYSIAELETSLTQAERRALASEAESESVRAELAELRERLCHSETRAAGLAGEVQVIADVRAHARKAAKLDSWFELSAERAQLADQLVASARAGEEAQKDACARVRAAERAAGQRVVRGLIASSRRRVFYHQLTAAILLSREKTRFEVDVRVAERERAAWRLQRERKVLQARYGAILSVARALGVPVATGADATGVFASHGLGALLSRTQRAQPLTSTSTAALLAASESAATATADTAAAAADTAAAAATTATTASAAHHPSGDAPAEPTPELALGHAR